MTKEDILPSFSHPLDAIVLAGSDPKHSIKGQNKAFLNIDGRPLLQHVIDALLGAQSIADIFAVGPVNQMSKTLPNVPHEVHLIEQKGNMLANCWVGINASESTYNLVNVTGDPSYSLELLHPAAKYASKRVFNKPWIVLISQGVLPRN